MLTTLKKLLSLLQIAAIAIATIFNIFSGTFAKIIKNERINNMKLVIPLKFQNGIMVSMHTLPLILNLQSL